MGTTQRSQSELVSIIFRFKTSYQRVDCWSSPDQSMLILLLWAGLSWNIVACVGRLNIMTWKKARLIKKLFKLTTLVQRWTILALWSINISLTSLLEFVMRLGLLSSRSTR